MGEIRRVTRDRMLTAEEAKAYQQIRDLESADSMQTNDRNLTAPGHRSFSDVAEVRQLVAFLRGERERQQLELAEIGRRTRYPADELAAVEAGETNPPLALLTRYARALGKQVILSLRQGDSWREAQTNAAEAAR